MPKIVILLSLIFIVSDCYSLNKKELKREIDLIIPPKIFKDIQIGVFAISLSKGDIIFEKNADTKLIPASVIKIFTSYAALKKLGPNSTFKTRVFRTGLLNEGTLTGNLFLKGGGDPSLVSERMWMLINELVRSGIKKINGDIVADSSYYDLEKTPVARPVYLSDEAFNAPIGALSFNFNTTTIYVKPAEKIGDKPLVYTDPENSYIDVVNQAKTGTENSKDTLSVKRISAVEGDMGDTVLLRGTLPISSNERRFYRNIVNPALYTANMFKTFWEQRSLIFKGKIIEGVTPSNAKLVIEFESLPLWQIIWGLNKFSNNFVGDQILKKLGAETWGVPGTIEKGLTAVRDILEDSGLTKDSYKMTDGSGLNRQTFVTARQVTKVLNLAYHDFSIFPEYIASFGISGVDGTLRRRFSSSKMKGRIRAKTGSLDGVASLAGYLETDSGEKLAFTIIINDPKLKYGKMSAWVDKIVTLLSKFSRRS